MLGSRNESDYPIEAELVDKQHYDLEPLMNTVLIYSRNCHNIGFIGPGTINGNGQEWTGYYRPMMLRFNNCSNIRVTDIKLRNPGSWNTAFVGCNNIIVRGIDIVSINSGNGDGLDFDSCSDVIVSDCIMDCSDDCICLQNSSVDKKCQNIAITNCILTSKWAAFRFGLLSTADFRDVVVSNCVIHDVSCSGFKIQMSEGASLSNMLIENITMRNVPRPIMMTLNHFNFNIDGPKNPPLTGKMMDIKFNNIISTFDLNSGIVDNIGIIIQGTKGFDIQNIELNNIDMTFTGGTQSVPAPICSVPEIDNQRPEYYIWNNQLPSYGVYISHARDISMSNVKIKLQRNDSRFAICLNDVKDIELYRMKVVDSSNNSVIGIANTTNLIIDNLKTYGRIRNLLDLQENNYKIVLKNTNLDEIENISTNSNELVLINNFSN
jgi:hypothetical protein